jgi:hypothetical protein
MDGRLIKEETVLQSEWLFKTAQSQSWSNENLGIELRA